VSAGPSVTYTVEMLEDGTAVLTCSAHGEFRRVPPGGNVGNTMSPHVGLDATMLHQLGQVIDVGDLSVMMGHARPSFGQA